MAIMNDEDEILHKIECKMYQNYLKKGGPLLARAKSEAPLTVENVCVSAKNRGGFTGQVTELIEHSHVFINEMIYQLLEGFSVQVGGLFSLHLRIGGTYQSEWDLITSDKLSVVFRELSHLKTLLGKVKIENEGLAGDGAYIDQVTDVTTESLGSTLTPGGMFALDGHKIKIAGTHADCGVYFVRDAPGPIYREKVSGNLADNTSNRIVGIIPSLLTGRWKVQVITQFSSGTTFTKEPRTIEFGSILTVL